MKHIITILILLMLAGCTNFKVTTKDGTVLLYQKVFQMQSAKRAEMYYEDPNCVVWVILNDPNSKVNPGKFKITEPKSGISAEIEAE